jgi:drug/metabolite transporter (DMT)-like permease
MPASAVAAALLAALLHAGWNLAVARADDPERRMRAACVWAAVLLTPLAAATWEVTPEAVPYMAGSALLHGTYFLALGRAYRTEDVDVVYAVSRGTGPVLLLVVGGLALGESVSAIAAAGVLAVAAGVAGLRLAGGHATHAGLLWGLGIGLFIAGYTLVDAEGVDRAEPTAYLVAVLWPMALVCLMLLRRTGTTAELRSLAPVVTGAGMIAAYVLVLWALQRAPAAPVAALRETSILLVALFAGIAGGARVAAAAIVVAGVALVVLG